MENLRKLPLLTRKAFLTSENWVEASDSSGLEPRPAPWNALCQPPLTPRSLAQPLGGVTHLLRSRGILPIVDQKYAGLPFPMDQKGKAQRCWRCGASLLPQS